MQKTEVVIKPFHVFNASVRKDINRRCGTSSQGGTMVLGPVKIACQREDSFFTKAYEGCAS